MSSKRPASEMLDYSLDDAPQAKKFKATEPQIVASNEEIDERVAKLIESKKSSQGSTQVQGHLQADSAAIAAAKSAHSTRAQSSTSGSTASDQTPLVTYSETLPPGLPDIIEDRLSVLEKKVYSNITMRSAPRDVYSRLKSLEERVVQLERQGIIGHRHVEAAHPTPAAVQEVVPQIEVPLPEVVDDRIKELQEKLAAQSHH